MKRYFLYITAAFVVLASSLFIFFKLTVHLENYPSLNSCIKVAVSGKRLCPTDTSYTKVADISFYLKEAVLISEDDKFYMHQGFDWSEIKNSFLANLRAFSFIRGGSTISQQLVKNLYLSQDKNLARKMKEAILAYQVEKKFKKDLIFERYLNMIEWGQNVWGVQAASQHYFKKSPGDLSLLESVYLAVIIPSPKKYDRLFREEGDLTSYQVRKIKLLLERLERKKVIGSQDKMEAEELILSFPWGDSINLDEEFFDYMYE